jgi:hypothetical protein
LTEIPATQEAQTELLQSESNLGKNVRHYLKKQLKQKWTGSMAQAVEHLTNKHKALSSNPSSTPPKKIIITIKGDEVKTRLQVALSNLTGVAAIRGN